MSGVDKSKVAKSFGAAAKGYDQVSVLQRAVSERLIERLDLIKLTPENILDIGAGTGQSARSLAKKFKRSRVFQLDLSQRMSIISRSKTSRFFSRQNFVCGDAESLPVTSSFFDLVHSSLTFQWCNDLDRCFSESVRVLNTNGLFIFATLGPDTLKELRECWAVVDDNIHINTFFDMHDIGDALVRAGLESVVMDVESITMTYTDSMDLMRELKALGAHNVNKDRHKGLTGKVSFKKMMHHYEKFRETEKLPASFEIIYGHAWKPATPITSRTDNGVSYVPVSAIKKSTGDI